MNQACERFKKIRRHTSSYNPRTDGQTERTIQTVTRLLIKHCLENPKDWSNTLNIVFLAYRTNVHNSTGFAPFYLMFGRQEKQVKKQNAQSNVSHDCLKQGEAVYVKNCKQKNRT